MKIGIVLHPYDEEKPSGLGRFIFELTAEMARQGSEHEFLLYLKKAPRIPLKLPGDNWKVLAGAGGGIFWMDMLLKRNEKADVYIFNTPAMPLFWKPPRSIVIALDFAYKKLPTSSLVHFFKNQFLLLYHARSLSRATHVVATSRATKNDCIRFFGIPEEKMIIIYPGFTRICSLPPKEVAIPPKYFFYIGTIKERKNVLNLVKAFILFKEKTNFPHKLLIGGNNSGTYYETIRRYIQEKGRENDVLFLGYISDEEASFVHRHAEAFVFVTLVEGSFGMPVLEAMDCGTPVITSDTETSLELREAKAALLADPYDSTAIAEAMKNIASDKALREKIAANGKAFSQKISWEIMAREMLDLVKKL